MPHIAKGARYTIGTRIENKLLDLLELAYIAYFAKKENKLEKITKCVLILDTLKFLISTAWEVKIISHAHFENIAEKLNEAGRMFGGWKNKIQAEQAKNRAKEARKENTFGGEKQTGYQDSNGSVA